jgi:hypothetical protein
MLYKVKNIVYLYNVSITIYATLNFEKRRKKHARSYLYMIAPISFCASSTMNAFNLNSNIPMCTFRGSVSIDLEISEVIDLDMRTHAMGTPLVWESNANNV